MKASLALWVDAGPLERVRADLAVATFFAGDRPLRGDAGRADWRLLGGLSSLIQREFLCGGPGEAALVPTLGRLRAPRLLLLGLGERKGFGGVQIRAATREAVLRSAGLGCRRIALTAPGGPFDALPPARVAEAVLRGALSALRERPALLELVLLGGDQASAALGGLAQLVKRASIPVLLRNPDLPETRGALAQRPRPGACAVQDRP